MALQTVCNQVFQQEVLLALHCKQPHAALYGWGRLVADTSALAWGLSQKNAGARRQARTAWLVASIAQ
jgi:hypothetical protein